MSKISQNKKFLMLDGIRVAYQAKDDSIHLTSTDKDLHGENFRLTLKPGTPSERILRNLLHAKGLLRVEAQDTLPKLASFVMDSSTPSDAIPLGEAVNGQVSWTPHTAPVLPILGMTGSGKSVIMSSILYHCVAHNDTWEVYAYDGKRIELSSFAGYTNTLQTIANTLEEAHSMIVGLYYKMQERYQRMEQEQVVAAHDLHTPVKNTLLVFEEVEELIYPVDQQMPHASAVQYLQDHILFMLDDLIRRGRAAGIYILAMSQRPDGEIMQRVLDQAHMIVTAGITRHISQPNTPLANISWFQELDAEEFQGIGHGRLHIQHDEPVDFRMYYSNTTTGHEWVKDNPHREPHVYNTLESLDAEDRRKRRLAAEEILYHLGVELSITQEKYVHEAVENLSEVNTKNLLKALSNMKSRNARQVIGDILAQAQMAQQSTGDDQTQVVLQYVWWTLQDVSKEEIDIVQRVANKVARNTRKTQLTPRIVVELLAQEPGGGAQLAKRMQAMHEHFIEKSGYNLDHPLEPS